MAIVRLCRPRTGSRYFGSREGCRVLVNSLESRIIGKFTVWTDTYPPSFGTGSFGTNEVTTFGNATQLRRLDEGNRPMTNDRLRRVILTLGPMIEMEAYSLLSCDLPPGHRVFINAACPLHPLAGTTPRFRPRVDESKAATTAFTSLRDDEETAACRGYQRNPLTLSTRSRNRTNV
jgi:hypothetical protein